ncbi:gamma-butyrobetaine hydroxylase-like domain-containing protein [Thalassotalea maritima]|uniref:gamma-butyrobetaine hydroxylase-like domain-containing protein n=1 Tax=Thalassotalea maritima TaxID=3242416 RepID=UPI0035279D12
MQIQRFTLDKRQAELAIVFVDGTEQQLSFELLRVYSPLTQTGQKHVVSHKKMVQLLAIEPVAKHGFRLLFDDQHSAVYSELLLSQLAQNKESMWQQYLQQLQTSGHSRETMIDIKQV